MARDRRMMTGMAAFAFLFRRLLRPARVVVAACAVFGAALFVAPIPAAAQDWGFLGGLFGGQQQVKPPPVDRPYYAPRRRVVAPRARATETRDADAPPPAAKIPSNASHFVVVIGDSLGQLLANGLDDALSDRPDTAVLHKARDSTGLVREDFYDWPKTVAELIAEHAKTPAPPAADAGPKPPAARERIDVAVMMIGSNDRQTISDGGKSVAPDTDEWTAIYTRRVTSIAEAFKKANIPLVWVGVPITKDSDFADDMAALNEIYRDVAGKTGATYVDTWEAFSDGNGDFSAFGPDINGQTVRLRSSDGIHFTKAGARKLAHFVDTHIRRALDQQSPATPTLVALPLPEGGQPGKAPAAPQAAKPDAGPVRALTEAPVAANGRLQSPAAYKALDRRDPLIETTLVKGEPQAAHSGRADDATWPPR